MTPDEAITIVTTVCAIPSQPSTWIIDKVYASARHYLPQARWLFLFDGVHQIQEDMRPGYEEYKKILKERINTSEWNNSEYMEFEEWGHQASMIREAVRRSRIGTPLILFLEHDFAFNYLPIDFQGIVNSLLEREMCYVRFALPEETRESIKNLNVPRTSRFIPVMETKNYSSLPHVCTLEFMQRLVLEFIHGRDHIECLVTEGIAFKEPQWRLSLYVPEGHLDRVYSLDGRQGRKKPEVTF
jgi:hypothetical protein